MHFFIIPAGFFLWYLAYKAKPSINEEVNGLWEEENVKRNKLINILNQSY